jgi:hypothetical protein
MGLSKGDLLKSYLDSNSNGGSKLVFEKVDLSPSVLAQAGVTSIPSPTNRSDYTEI